MVEDNRGTRITVGTVQVGAGGDGGGLGSGAVSNMGALVFQVGGALSVPGVIAGTGALTKAGVAALSDAALDAALTLGTRAAAVTVSRAGANPPWRAEL